MSELVSCVLTFSNPNRLSLARKAVNNFIYQRYTPYELLIVNGTSQSVLTNSNMETDYYKNAGTVREIKAPAGLNAAAMRNIGLKQSEGTYALCIDDDDYFHPDRLIYQMAHRGTSDPCMLKYQLRIDLSSVLWAASAEEPPLSPSIPSMHLLAREAGIPCTVLFPRCLHGVPWLFNEDLNTGEYEDLVGRFALEYSNISVLDNKHTPFNKTCNLPLLSIAMYHGFNELSFIDFFSKTELQPNDVDKLTGLNQHDIEHIKTVLRSYNFQVE